MRSLTRLANQRITAQLAFHHPLEIAIQETVNQKDVERPLMVAHKDIGLPFLQILTPFNLDGKQQNLDDKPSPVFTGIITPEMTVAQRTSYHHRQRCEDGGKKHERSRYKQLIYAI